MKPAYYNEIDPFAADWLRNLILFGLIAPGDVDTRSIEDVRPDDLKPYGQCHFFAGVGVWSLALRNAGWPDDRPVWTASCPCQPFSAAGEGAGFADERHLWPSCFHLVRERRPSTILGEQVASKDADPWVDLVCADLEALGYAFGAVPFPAASVGAPHIRERTYWVADASGAGLEGRYQGALGHERAAAERGRRVGGLVNSARLGWREGGRDLGGRVAALPDARAQLVLRDAGATGELGDADRQRLTRGQERDVRPLESEQQAPRGPDAVRPGVRHAGPSDGFWGSADWVFCRDEKWRPVEPGTFPLAHGAAARVGRLRAYGNAINAVQAQIFVEEVMACLS